MKNAKIEREEFIEYAIGISCKWLHFFGRIVKLKLKIVFCCGCCPMHVNSRWCHTVTPQRKERKEWHKLSKLVKVGKPG